MCIRDRDWCGSGLGPSWRLPPSSGVTTSSRPWRRLTRHSANTGKGSLARATPPEGRPNCNVGFTTSAHAATLFLPTAPPGRTTAWSRPSRQLALLRRASMEPV
eukprot:15305473-Alexandrium_andersonii.AAC.1